MSHDYSKQSSKEFDNIADEYDKGRKSENIQLWGIETRRLAHLSEDSIVLDLGCGTGLYTVGVGVEANCIMLGMDPVPNMLGQARDKSQSVNWFAGIGERLPLRPAVIDCIFSSQVWHHIEDKQGTANECCRVLKLSSYIVIRTISHAQLHRKVVFHYFPEIKQNQLNVYPSNENFIRYLTNAGFKDIDFHEYSEERYQSVDDFIEIAQKRLWSMFRLITEDGLRKGVAKLYAYKETNDGAPVRNDELITLVVAVK